MFRCVGDFGDKISRRMELQEIFPSSTLFQLLSKSQLGIAINSHVYCLPSTVYRLPSTVCRPLPLLLSVQSLSCYSFCSIHGEMSNTPSGPTGIDRKPSAPTQKWHYPFWFGGSAASMAAVVTHPLDLGLRALPFSVMSPPIELTLPSQGPSADALSI
jgi:hypothetical protein